MITHFSRLYDTSCKPHQDQSVQVQNQKKMHWLCLGHGKTCTQFGSLKKKVEKTLSCCVYGVGTVNESAQLI